MQQQHRGATPAHPNPTTHHPPHHAPSDPPHPPPPPPPPVDALTELSDKYASKISKKCQDKLLSLADCTSDNDPFAGTTTTSLSTTNGCCLTGCAEAIKVVGFGITRAWSGARLW